ncbi:1-hydroxy-2-methyl-2-butenyl 4-diphosphate reductase [Kitasatospora sp. NBC_01250]|uniref:5'-methylthioadenosine/S-adenosylhomocysteine nucleosidase family protein n=1 Tax=unclassified Kitasatospora TaxID=2633591 RepID=UPI002E1412F3|nr:MULTISPECIES: 1-hydroxy-2-methyl-2-butenyl 4-diphosphate reductase [unclassified Kitasatospora]WSJ70440.1 1-hydroxy-2-methyl-2-butenyl 4-diphosphate reductase [Kitasatospora sp. NBC_01302]
MSAPLLVLCALPAEEWALRRGDWAQALGGPPVLARTGMGPARAGRTAGTLLSAAPQGYGAVLMTGFCAAAVSGTRPGEVIVSDRVHCPAGRVRTTDQPAPLARALTGLGLSVRTGTLHSADHVVSGHERRVLSRQGILAVDMESAAVFDSVLDQVPDGLPMAAVRVVVDTPERELFRPGTVPAGLRAFRTLRALVPALLGWHRAVVGAGAGAQHLRSIPEPADPALLTHSSLPTLPQEAS